MKDDLRHARFGVLLVYPDSKKAALGSPGFRQVFRTLSGLDGAVVDWGWYDEKNERIINELRMWKKQYRYVALSIPFELLYRNAIRVLILLGIEPEKGLRKPDEPVVILGGAAPTINPSIAKTIADTVVAGEIEAHITDMADNIFIDRNSGAAKRLTPMIGISIPIKVHAAPDFISPVGKIDSSMIDDFDDPAMSIFENAGLVEVGRGCSRGCRFCAAGHIYLPARHRDVEDVLRDARSYSGYADRIGLVGAAVSDHGSLKEIMRGILDMGFGLTTSSFRVDMIDEELAALLREGGLKTLTMAPEGGSERIRRVINKRLTEDRILDAAKICAGAGFRMLRLYFMVGLPREQKSDIEAVIDLTSSIRKIFGGGGKRITVSVNPFIPKPQTPFQWCGMAEPDYIKDAYSTLKRAFLRMSGVSFRAMSVRAAVREAVISLGGEAVGKALIENVRDAVPWKKALAGQGVDAEKLVHSMKQPDERFPWDDITGEKRKAALLASFEKSRRTASES